MLDTKQMAKKLIGAMGKPTTTETSVMLRKIEWKDQTLNLQYPVYFSVDNRTTNNVGLENELLDIYANGKNMDEALLDVAEQFIYTYNRICKLDDDKLSKHLLNAKKYLLLLIS